MIQVAVLGAGINGLACALKIKEKYNNFNVVLISKDFTPNTTGDGSGGLWYPYLCGTTSGQLLAKWGKETYNFLHELWLEGGHGVVLMPMYSLYKDQEVDLQPIWSDNVFGFHSLGYKKLQYFNKLYSGEYMAGHTLTTFVSTASRLLEYLHTRYINANGFIMKAEISSLNDPELDQYQIVVNCTGLRAKELASDEKVYPIRGQVTRVLAPWINEIVVDNDAGTYIIPNSETCVLGGTHQENNYNTGIDEKDKSFILNECQKINRSLKHAKVTEHWCGLRPGRDEVRLDAEIINGKLYIHNYGHGGSGLTLFWGCASDVLTTMEDYLKKNNMISKCKL